MIYITGDTHADFQGRFSMDSFPDQKGMTKNDYVIICGDFGGIWNVGKESKSEKWWLDWFEERNYSLLFIDGNHENYDRLYEYPVKEWNGGRVHEIRSHVLHLMRGQVYEIDGKKIFTFGGAKSHDITGGILEREDPMFSMKKKRLDEDWIPYRINHIDWWDRELASDDEMQEGINNLTKHSFSVDYIITHCCATSTQNKLKGVRSCMPDPQTEYLEQIKKSTNYEKWFFGHYHNNIAVNKREMLIYDRIIKIC